ncbi:MAG: hypothetical protein HKN16_13690 [Saprospiraceae bacterium]|nr:hypothetical protein [Saprospiraceae bacterium]
MFWIRKIDLRSGLLLLLTYVLSSCSPDEQGPAFECMDSPEACFLQVPLDGFSDFEVCYLGRWDTMAWATQIQFFDEEIGFALGDIYSNLKLSLAFTLDRGATWDYLERKHPFPGFLEVNANQMLMSRPDFGIVSYFNSGPSYFRITEAENWTIVYPEGVEGNLYFFQRDSHENLYAIDMPPTIIPRGIIKSDEDGFVWDLIYSDDVDYGYHFMYKLFEDRLYISMRKGILVEADLDGNVLNEFDLGYASIEDFAIVDKNNFVAVTEEAVWKTSDGGNSWTEIFQGKAMILGFLNTNELFLLKQLDFDVSTSTSSDVIAFTKDGGQTWEHSPEIEGLFHRYRAKQVINQDLVYFAFVNCLYAFRRI